MAYRILRTWRRPRASGVLPRHASYHDYVRYTTPGDRLCSASFFLGGGSDIFPSGTVRVPLSFPKVMGVANSRGEREWALDLPSTFQILTVGH